MKNKIIKEDEIDIAGVFNFYLKHKWYIIILVIIFAVGSVVGSLLLDNQYVVSCKIKVADPSQETLSNSIPQGLSGFSLTGKDKSPVIQEIFSTLNSKDFIFKIYTTYANEKKLFDDKLNDIRNDNSLNKNEKIEKLFEDAYSFLLEEVIKFSDESNIITISVELKDKFFAKDFLLNLVTRLKKEVRNKNIAILKKDIEFYKENIKNYSNPVILNQLNTIISNRVKRLSVLTANVYTIYDSPYIPYLKSYPRRSIICIIGTLIGGIIGFLIVGIKLFIKNITE